jgi:hypothetical protein
MRTTSTDGQVRTASTDGQYGRPVRRTGSDPVGRPYGVPGPTTGGVRPGELGLDDMTQGLRMVHLRTVPDAWQAKVIAARLGSEGILTHLQGSVAGPYPFGTVSVLVEAEQADLAVALLLADEVESAFAGHRLAMASPNATGEARGDGEPGQDDIFGFPADDLEDAAVVSKPCASWRRRALAAVAAVVVAGAPVLAHFIGQ